MPQGVVLRRHQLDLEGRSVQLGGGWMIGLDRDRFAIRLDPHPGSRHRLGRFQAMIDEVRRTWVCSWGWPSPPIDPKIAQGRLSRAAIAGMRVCMVRFFGSSRLTCAGSRLEIAAAILEQHPGAFGDDA